MLALDRYESLVELASAVAAGTALSETLHLLALCAAEGLGASRCDLYDYLDKTGEFVVAASYHAPDLELDASGWIGTSVAHGNWPELDESAAGRRVMVVYRDDPELPAGRAAVMDEAGEVAAAGAPLVFEGHVLGVIDVGDGARGRRWSDDDLRFLQAAADFSAVAVAMARSEASLAAHLIRDELTGLFNFRHFMERLRREVAVSRRYGHDLSLLLIDLDGFRMFNQTFGRDRGDAALAEVAGSCRRSRARTSTSSRATAATSSSSSCRRPGPTTLSRSPPAGSRTASTSASTRIASRARPGSATWRSRSASASPAWAWAATPPKSSSAARRRPPTWRSTRARTASSRSGPEPARAVRRVSPAPAGATASSRSSQSSHLAGARPIQPVMAARLEHTDWLSGRVPDEVRTQIRKVVEVLGYIPHKQPLAVVTADGVLLAANRPLLDLVGCPDEDLLECEWADLMLGWDERASRWAEADEPGTHTFEAHLCCADAVKRWTHVVAVPVMAVDDVPAGLVGARRAGRLDGVRERRLPPGGRSEGQGAPGDGGPAARQPW